MSYAPPSARARGLGDNANRIRIITPKPFDQLTVDRRQAACAACEWNIQWVCENIGCKVCPGRQKKIAIEPLKTLIKDPFFVCPIKQF